MKVCLEELEVCIRFVCLFFKPDLARSHHVCRTRLAGDLRKYLERIEVGKGLCGTLD